jgi:hypothetical protein
VRRLQDFEVDGYGWIWMRRDEMREGREKVEWCDLHNLEFINHSWFYFMGWFTPLSHLSQSHI